MNDQLALAAIALLNTLIQQAAEVSARIAAGTVDQAFLDSLDAKDAAARAAQVEAQERAQAEGR